MTNLVDLDRALAAFLDDGPNTAPEAPVIAALAHARTTPRRADPLGWLRADVMAPRRTFGVVSRPGLLLGLAALLIAGVGVAVIGSRSQEPSVVVPGPSKTNAPTTSVEPFSILPVALFNGTVQVDVAAGQPLTLTISDTTGGLVDAKSLTPGDGASVESGKVAVAADPAAVNVLIATWVGSTCETRAAMFVDEPRFNISITSENCSGDAIALDRVVRLTFRDPVDVNAWNGTAIRQPLSVQITAAGVDSGGGRYELTMVDGSATVVAISAVDPSKLGDFPPGNSGLDGTSARTIRLSWGGHACETAPQVTIDPAGHEWRLVVGDCNDTAPAVVRAVDFTFKVAPPVDSIRFTGPSGP